MVSMRPSAATIRSATVTVVPSLSDRVMGNVAFRGREPGSRWSGVR